nr:immunoglobulin heavy chain junction region [Mus musculus]
CGRLGYYFDYW